jgi:hypothetical protein
VKTTGSQIKPRRTSSNHFSRGLSGSRNGRGLDVARWFVAPSGTKSNCKLRCVEPDESMSNYANMIALHARALPASSPASRYAMYPRYTGPSGRPTWDSCWQCPTLFRRGSMRNAGGEMETWGGAERYVEPGCDGYIGCCSGIAWVGASAMKEGDQTKELGYNGQ